MATYKTPGVYVEEISIFPPSVAQVETAIPAFIGYTERGPSEPTKIKSMVDFEVLFGGSANELPSFAIAGEVITGDINVTPVHQMYYAMQMYFGNGGGPCYILSVGNYNAPGSINSADIVADALEGALSLLRKEDEPTLILFPDAGAISDSSTYLNIYVQAMKQCAELGDRFTLCDVKPESDPADPVGKSAQEFRAGIGTNNLMYGAAYYPLLQTTLAHDVPDSQIAVSGDDIGSATVLRHSDSFLDASATEEERQDREATSLFHADNGIHREKYYEIRRRIADAQLVLPPSSAIAGVYASIDSSRGVWKSPANVSLNYVKKPSVHIENSEQDGLNVSDTGKSINAIRFFTGKGTMVWGARTLDGNSNEWRYVSVRRFFNMVEESVKKASERFVFEPNDANTWVKVKAMIENFLVLQWRAGAMMGAKAEEAFFVKVGLGETMTADDVLNGRLIVEIGMAVVRPAEFIILRFSHKMME